MTPFELTEWPCPAGDGALREELALVFDKDRGHRLLVLPAWFDEANKLRRLTVEVMRRLDLGGIDSFLPDLPGTNESEAPLAHQSLSSWRAAASEAAAYFRATHVWALRAGTLIAPPELPGWGYAPLSGAKVLRAMLRARTIASREAGRAEKIENLQATGRSDGVELAGWEFGSALFGELEQAEPAAHMIVIDQADLPGSGLWLRAEPGDEPEQSDMLAALLTMGMTGT